MTRNLKSILFAGDGARKKRTLAFPTAEATRVVSAALREDSAGSDITSACLFKKDVYARAVIVSKENGVLAGVPAALLAFRRCDASIKLTVMKKDGSRIRKGDVIINAYGPVRGILAAERTALNFLQRLSGIATLTHAYAQKLKGLKTKLLDTRKTTPGMRLLEKYAVAAGGGVNHRFSLADGILIKDNHIKAAGNIRECVRLAKESGEKVEVEVATLKELHDVLSLKTLPDIIMLDNMDLKEMRDAVGVCKGKVKLEASGNVRFNTIRNIAKTGVDYISCGRLTHSARALDLSLDIVSVKHRQ